MTSSTSTSEAQIAPASEAAHDSNFRSGLISALLAYSAWGFLPLLFHFLGSVDAATIVADRTVWSLVLVGAILLVSGRFDEVRAVFKDGKAMRGMAVSALLLAANWLLYVWAVEAGRVLEASFGYFINPLVNVAIGMVLLGERQNRWQAVSILIALIAMLIQAVGVGGIPFVSLGLALSFGFYGYFRKTASIGSTPGLFIETLIILPLAAGYLTYGFMTEGLGPHADPFLFGLLMFSGVATAVPLLLFAFAIQRLRLTTIGMLQYIAPTLQFILAITFFQEELNAVRMLSFALIWLSLMVFTFDSLRRRGKAVEPVHG